MFRNTYQSGFLSILYSVGSQPLSIWNRRVENGHIKRISDEDVKSQVVEIAGTNVATTYIFCPQDPKVSLGVKLKFLVLIIKNLNKYFSFEITVLDNTSVRRRLRASNYQSTTRVRPFSCSMPMSLNPGWNQVQFNLADFTKRAYGTEYLETTRIQIHANCRIRRVYFADKLYTEDDVPPEYRLYVNDDPRTRRFSEPPTAMTSAALTAAVASGGPYRPVDCSGTAAAPPTPCGGDIIREETPLTAEKMKSFMGVPPLGSIELLPNVTNNDLLMASSGLGKQASKYLSLTTPASKPGAEFTSGSKAPSFMADRSSANASKDIGLTSPDSMYPMPGSRAPSYMHEEFKSITAGSKPPSLTAGSKPPSLMAGSKPPSLMAGSKPPSLMAGSKPPSLMAASKPPSLTAGSKQPSLTAGSKPPSVLAASSQAPLSIQPPSMTAAAPASAEMIANATEEEYPE